MENVTINDRPLGFLNLIHSFAVVNNNELLKTNFLEISYPGLIVVDFSVKSAS